MIVTDVEYETFRDSQLINDIEELDIDLEFGVGNIEVTRSLEEGILYDLDLEYDRLHYEPDLSFDGSGSDARLRFELDSSGPIPVRDNDNDLTLRLASDVPIELNLSAGVGQSYLDFTDIKLRRLRIEGGVGQSEVTFDSPQAEPVSLIEIQSGVGEVTVRGLGNARVETFRFEGGVGSAQVDFTGDWGESRTQAQIEVGIGELDLLIPEDLAVEIVANDSFLNSFSAPDFTRRGGRYVRNLSEGQSPQATIRMDSGLGEIRVRIR